MAKRKSKKDLKISLGEFKTWLEGVHSMQKDDWQPDAEQWKMIVERINDIEEVAAAPIVAAAPLTNAPVVHPNNPAAGQLLTPAANPAANPAGKLASTAPVQRLNLPSGNGQPTRHAAPSALSANPALSAAKPVGAGNSTDLSGESSGDDAGILSVSAVSSEDGTYKPSFT